MNKIRIKRFYDEQNIFMIFKVFTYLEVAVKCQQVTIDKDLKVLEPAEDFLKELFPAVKGE